MNARRWLLPILLAGILAARADNSGTDANQKYAWAENTGWANAAPTNGGVTVCFNGNSGYLSGLAWGENNGWIKFGADGGGPYANTSASDWGVNMDRAGGLSGYAWGENVGWINFSHPYGMVSISPATGKFSGSAWGENIGWVTFKGAEPPYGVRTLAFDTQPHGTPNWWLDRHAVTEGYDAGDGVPAWQKYVMDTDPNVAGDYLRITALSNGPTSKVVSFTPTSPRRYYTLTYREDPTAGGWSNVVGQVRIVGAGGAQALQDANTLTRAFYSVSVTVTR